MTLIDKDFLLRQDPDVNIEATVRGFGSPRQASEYVWLGTPFRVTGWDQVAEFLSGCEDFVFWLSEVYQKASRLRSKIKNL